MLRGTKPGTRPVASILWSWLGSSHTEFRRPPSSRPSCPRDVIPGPDAGKTGLANEGSTIAHPQQDPASGSLACTHRTWWLPIAPDTQTTLPCLALPGSGSRRSASCPYSQPLAL